MNRNKINDLIELKKNSINNLNNEIIELQRQSYLLSDKDQWFTENIETVVDWDRSKKDKRRKDWKITKEVLVGRIHWNQEFIDEDTNNSITIERSQVVRVDGEWKYFI